MVFFVLEINLERYSTGFFLYSGEFLISSPYIKPNEKKRKKKGL
jgi:hypothetical protein